MTRKKITKLQTHNRLKDLCSPRCREIQRDLYIVMSEIGGISGIVNVSELDSGDGFLQTYVQFFSRRVQMLLELLSESRVVNITG